MKRGTIIGVAGGLFAGVSLATLAIAAPNMSFFGGEAGASVTAPMVSQVTAPIAAQTTHWGTVPDLADLVEKVSPSVVMVVVRSPSEVKMTAGPGSSPFEGTPFEDFFGRGFGFPGQGGQNQGELPDRMGSGSGFFIEGGYIVTNNHVVDNAKKVTVRMADGKEIDATVVGTDPKTDIAVIKVDAKYAPSSLKWGSSDKARPGDSVFAMGSPFSLGNTVTAGIISARGRDIRSGPYDDYIQVDAPINQGNSGGPLFNAAGEVIGVNSAIYSPTGGNVGIGFSIPSDLARSIAQQIIDNGSVARGWLGVQIQQVTPDMAKGLNLGDAKGAMVADVTDGSPAQKAGFKVGDVILFYGDHPVSEVHDLTRAVADTKAGSTKDVRILRSGKQQTIKVKIAALEDDAAGPVKLAGSTPKPTATRSTLSLDGLGLDLATEDGVVVAGVKVNSSAADVGLKPGDKVVMVNQTEVNTAEAARKAVDEARKQKREAVLFQIEREGRTSFVGIPFQAG
jgi:serine protease Do